MNKIKNFITNIEYYIRNGVHNPLSTMTNLTYVLLGYLALPHSFVLGTLMIILGICSTGFHWVRNDAWHKADIVAIYYVFAVLAGFLWLGNLGIILGFILGGFAHWMFDGKPDVSSRHVIAVLGVLVIVPFWLVHGWEESLFALMWFALAGGTHSIGMRYNPEEDGKVYDVFHSIWHIFSGIGIFNLVMKAVPLFYILKNIV